MTTICARPATLAGRSQSPPPTLSLNTSIRGTPSAVPNKHLPTCSPGPRPQSRCFDSPTASPAQPSAISEPLSLLRCIDSFPRVSSRPPVYALTAEQLDTALNDLARQPLPDPKLVFPWLHGLHPENNLQLAFFVARRKALRKAPRSMRTMTIVKAGGDLTHSKLKGAVAPDELLYAGKNGEGLAQFLDIDPREGFSVRNFQIQAAKLATVSDMVVYGDDKTPKEEVKRLAERLARAQRVWKEKDKEAGIDRPTFSTFVLQDPFSKIEHSFPEIVAVDSHGHLTGHVPDFSSAERAEMRAMSAPSAIAKNVWLGPTLPLDTPAAEGSDEHPATQYDLLIEATDLAQVPDRKAFSVLDRLLSSSKLSKTALPQLEFPGSGSIMPPTWSQTEVDGLMHTCAWLYKQANGLTDSVAESVPDSARQRKDSKVAVTPPDSEGDSIMAPIDELDAPTHEQSGNADGRKILLHCADGYTETTLLAVAYYMYANCVPLHTAYVELHTKHKRNFFAYPTDIALLTTIQPRILQNSPASGGRSFIELSPPMPDWMCKIDGSLPSRIMDYMYLGNLNHANNPGMLKELGIGQVLSIGEPVTWSEQDRQVFQSISGANADDDVRTRMMFVDRVQDNGVDPLAEEFVRCLDFIERGRKAGTATLVHCRVGVSRSATICIAEVMNELGISFPKAYCFVRARRLNVIIQPHLRFSYELLKYEEYQARKHNRPFKRDLEWATIAREIAAMNKPYSRQ